MKIDRRDGTQQRNVLIGMVVSDAVCGAVAAKWPDPEGLFESRWSNLIGSWAVAYYRKYRRAPGRQLANIFDAWASKGNKDKEVVKLVETFLAGLSDQYARLRKGVQADYLIDVAGAYFTEVQLRKAHAAAGAALEAGNPEKAAEEMAQSRKVDLVGGRGFNLLEDKEVLKRAFAAKGPPLVQYPDALGVLLGSLLSRDSLISFEGPEKRGKTWWLLDLAWRAMLQGRKVAFFEIGDLSESQIRMRFAVRNARRPFGTEPFQYPTAIEPPGDGKFAHPMLKEGKCEKPLSFEQVSKLDDKLNRRLQDKTKSKTPLFKLFTCPARGVSVSGIGSVLNAWENQEDGWNPDVVVIDYADILAPEAGIADTRDQINLSWILMRALSSQRRCLVVTATQTNAKSYDAELLDMDNFSEDKRKRSHVNGIIALNQTETEQEEGVYRISTYAVREQKFDKRKVVHCAGSLALANPVMFSCF